MQYFRNSFYEYATANPNIGIAAIILYSWLLILFLSQIIIHEGGHCVFGLLTGYRFFSFRILSYTLIKENNKFKIRRYKFPGSFGQCLMIPPKNKGNSHFIIFFMGGVIADTVIALLTAWLAFGSHNLIFVLRCCFMTTFLYTFGSVLINGIPSKQGKISTDGTNVFALITNRQAKESCYLQLSAIPLMQNGYTYTSFPKEIITVPEGADLTNPLIIWHKFMECYYYMELKQWDKALECVNKIEELGDKNCKIIKITESSEKLFLFIKLGKNPSEIEGLYNRLNDVLSRDCIDFNLTRVRLAYELYKDNSKQNQDRIRLEIEEKAAVYPYKGEAKFCSDLIGEMLVL